MVLEYIIFGFFAIAAIAFIWAMLHGTATNIISYIFSRIAVARLVTIIVMSIILALVIAVFDGGSWLYVGFLGKQIFFVWFGLLLALGFVVISFAGMPVVSLLSFLLCLPIILIAKMFGYDPYGNITHKVNVEKYKPLIFSTTRC